jgi:hypothetical protein
MMISMTIPQGQRRHQEGIRAKSIAVLCAMRILHVVFLYWCEE